jgi:hypothetical protein
MSLRVDYIAGKETHRLEYGSFSEAFEDTQVADSLDGGHAKCVLWWKDLRLTGSPIANGEEYRKAIEAAEERFG